MREENSYQELLLRYLDGNLSPDEEAQVAELLRSNAQARAFLRDVAEQAVTVADVERSEGSHQDALRTKQNWAGSRRRRWAGWSWVLGAAACLALVANISFYMLNTEPKIVTITGMSGPVPARWTGNGGRVFHDLRVGTKLSGGTVEGLTPGSWFELTFDDDSTVTLSGNSTLTFADHGQKTLYLKEGSLSSHVTAQPAGKPMLVYTRSALLEVLGTQFDVEAELAATTLNVSEGKVRLKRLSDGTTVDVKAKQRVVAADDREMQPVSVPEAVGQWKSQLHVGPEGTYGKWSSNADGQEARLETIPLTIPEGFTIYAAALDVSHGDRPPVVLQPGSRLRVRGHMASTHDVYFGVTVRYLSGGFAGKFQTIRPAAEFQSGQDFEGILGLEDFQLDLLLVEIKDKLPRTPFHLVVESIWCHTLDRPSGLEITEMELLPPTASGNPAAFESLQPLSMDIWAAAAQGDLRTVQRHLAGGIDIDEAFVASGIPGSGATPLHMAVLFDQQEVARFLIDQGANVDAPAQDEHGGTPLHWAAVFGRVEMATQLIDAGANVNITDKNGTPLDATTYEQFSDGRTRLAIAELLRQRGGKTRDEQGNP